MPGLFFWSTYARSLELPTTPPIVIPAKAGIQGRSREASQTRAPAIAGATESAYFFFGMYRSVIVPS